jgi:hypothetical protein
MNNTMKINNIEWKNEDLVLKADSIGINLEKVSATARVLADSDRFSFIYILETSDSYVYVSIPEEYWSALKKVIENHIKVTLEVNNETIQLEGIVEELQYLIQNIEGNANYGEEMVTKVESIFL